MIRSKPSPTITLSVSQARRQWSELLSMIEETDAIALLTSRRRLTFALLPCTIANGRGIAITRGGRSVAALVGPSDDTSLWRIMRTSSSPTPP